MSINDDFKKLELMKVYCKGRDIGWKECEELSYKIVLEWVESENKESELKRKVKGLMW